jgi:hypothetical protein
MLIWKPPGEAGNFARLKIHRGFGYPRCPSRLNDVFTQPYHDNWTVIKRLVVPNSVF